MMKTMFFILVALAVSFGIIFYGEIPWDIAWEGVLKRLAGFEQSWNPILDERLPRLIVLLCSGASLAVAGAVMQSLFQNPLAAPNVLGMSVGGTLATIVVLIFEWHFSYPFVIPLAAVGGSLGILLLVYGLSYRQHSPPMVNLILTGIAISTVLIAAQSALLYALREHWQLIQTITEWEAGSSLDRSWAHVHMQLPLTLIGLWGCFQYREEINILALGEDEAANLGVEVTKIRWRLFLCIALLTGGALAAVGVVAFFGLVLPHLVRTLTTSDNRTLIPLCAFIGGVTLASLDLSLRILHIHTFTIGNISAVLGGIFFLVILLQPNRSFRLQQG